MLPRVFVYGTLKSGEGANSFLQGTGARFLGKFETLPKFTMYDLGPYPALTLNGETSIKGEVWETAGLVSIDRYEGYPNLYDRVIMNTPYGNAWVYVMKSTDRFDHYMSVESGEWNGIAKHGYM